MLKIMNFLEKDLEDIIFNAPKDQIDKRGLIIPKRRKRQVKIGNYGIADMLAVKIGETDPGNKFLHFYVYELKQKEINFNTFIQSIKYVKGLQDYLQKNKKLHSQEYKITIVLIGEKVSMVDFIYLPDIFQYNVYSCYGVDIELYKYSYEYDGIKFNQLSDYSLSNSGF
jgi:hypothetical protein